MAKRYYWLKLKEGFFAQPKIKKLRKMAGGDTYILIYLKIQLVSLARDGILIYEGLEDSFTEELALTLDEEVENVRFTLLYLQKYGLLKEVKEDMYVLTETIQNIGTESAAAERVRKHRQGQKALQCNTSVTKCNTELEKEIDIEIEKDTEKEIEIKTTTGTDEEVDFTPVMCGQIVTTAEEMGKAADYIGRAVRQFWKRDAAEDDVERGFAKCCTMSRQYEQDIGMFDEDKGLMLTCAMSLAAEKGERACNWYYVYAIYANWERLGLHDICAVNQHELERSQR